LSVPSTNAAGMRVAMLKVFHRTASVCYPCGNETAPVPGFPSDFANGLGTIR
jgi:hypothetical protein